MAPIIDSVMTYTAGYFSPLNPHPDDVFITDIAHGLSLMNRFCGQTDFPWSVAQHSLAMSYVVPGEHALACLLHDASEAYMADVPKPVKNSLPDYVRMEDGVLECIGRKFRVDLKHPAVKAADVKMLVTEAAVLFHGRSAWWLDPQYPQPYSSRDVSIIEEPWRSVKYKFLRRFRELTR